MPLTDFDFAGLRGVDALIRCSDGSKLVVGIVPREVIINLFNRLRPGEALTLPQSRTFVQTNMEVWAEALAEKYERNVPEMREFQGIEYPHVVLTLSDVERTGTMLSVGDLANTN